jgi:hypothetical protein
MMAAERPAGSGGGTDADIRPELNSEDPAPDGAGALVQADIYVRECGPPLSYTGNSSVHRGPARNRPAASGSLYAERWPQRANAVAIPDLADPVRVGRSWQTREVLRLLGEHTFKSRRSRDTERPHWLIVEIRKGVRHLSGKPDQLPRSGFEPSITDDEGHHTTDDESGFILSAVDVEPWT